LNGLIQEQVFVQQAIASNAFQIIRTSEFKGAHKLANSVFEVAFADEIISPPTPAATPFSAA
jgi:hypothetical protein